MAAKFIKPEFFSVTFGALGSSQDATFETITNLLNNTNIPIAPHLTCVGIKEIQAMIGYNKLQRFDVASTPDSR